MARREIQSGCDTGAQYGRGLTDANRTRITDAVLTRGGRGNGRAEWTRYGHGYGRGRRRGRGPARCRRGVNAWAIGLPLTRGGDG